MFFFFLFNTLYPSLKNNAGMPLKSVDSILSLCLQGPAYIERKLDVEAKFTYHLMSVLYYKKKNLMWGGGEGCGNKLLGNEVNLVLKVISFR